jgi:hypothetical protein
METSTTTTPVNKRVNKSIRYAPPSATIRLTCRQTLKDLILKKNYSITAAADALDMDETLANSWLFNNKPTQMQIDKAIETYNKGLPLLHACVVAGVSFKAFKQAMQATKNNTRRTIMR